MGHGGFDGAAAGRRLAAARALIWIACVLGLIHAGFSLYWALGGVWLLPTVGEWAVTARTNSPLGAGLLLGGIAALKAAAAVVPVAVFYGKLPWPRIWRCLSWVGGLLLVAYGGANVLISGAVLAGVLRPAGGYNVEAMIGHAFLWDPLFLVWGAALTASLWLSATRRTPRPAAGGQAEELG